MEGNKGAYHGHRPPLDAESLTSPEHLSCRLSPEPQTQALNPKPRTSNPHELGAHEQPLLSARGPIIELDLAGNLLQTAGAQVLARAVWGGGLSTLQSLNLSNNLLQDQGLKSLFSRPPSPPSRPAAAAAVPTDALQVDAPCAGPIFASKAWASLRRLDVSNNQLTGGR